MNSVAWILIGLMVCLVAPVTAEAGQPEAAVKVVEQPEKTTSADMEAIRMGYNLYMLPSLNKGKNTELFDMSISISREYFDKSEFNKELIHEIDATLDAVKTGKITGFCEKLAKPFLKGLELVKKKKPTKIDVYLLVGMWTGVCHGGSLSKANAGNFSSLGTALISLGGLDKSTDSTDSLLTGLVIQMANEMSKPNPDPEFVGSLAMKICYMQIK